MIDLLYPDPAIDALETEVILPNRHLNPTLGVIIKTDAPKDDKAYLQSIQKYGKKYNVNILIQECENIIAAHQAVNDLKQNPTVCGIIVLSHFGGADSALYNSIPTRLDIDCLSSVTLGRLVANTSNIGYRLAPCAAVAIWKILEYNGHKDLSGYKVAILGRSLRVGRPLAEILCQKNATVTVFHTKSPEYKRLEDYDIVISAIGLPKEISYYNFHYFEDHSGNCRTKIIIDTGINTDENGKICGDIDIDSFRYADDELSLKITPTPGGVGKMAIVCLFAKVFSNAVNMYSSVEAGL